MSVAVGDKNWLQPMGSNAVTVSKSAPYLFEHVSKILDTVFKGCLLMLYFLFVHRIGIVLTFPLVLSFDFEKLKRLLNPYKL